MNKITVLFPGGFKPLTGAHLELATRYAQDPQVERVVMLIGPKERDGITRDKTMEMFELLNSNPKIQIQSTEFNSPIMAAYEYLFALPEDATGHFAMAASAKGDDYVRAKDFVPNVDKYATIGDKKGRKIPAGINATELSINVDPLTYANGTPVSATVVRQALADDNYEAFRASYPQYEDAYVKNAWQILKGVREAALFTKEWWSAALHEDIQEVIEAIMNPKEKTKHDSKINHLRSFLEKHRGEEFVYDFDNFSKTVVGAKLIESILTENYITRDELAKIEPIVDRFFKRFGIDVDFQGKFTHFIERLNDPRNEGTIRLDDLENLFRDLSDEYGADIVRQFQQGNTTAVESDYQFDVPLHMPFQLEFDRQIGQIKLIPRTIKAQHRPWTANDPNDVIYKIESAMHKNEDRIKCRKCTHSWPVKTGGKDLYVCHECGHDNNPALTESKILTEGGAAGHMAHPYDDHGLTFNEMKDLVSRALEGRLDIEEAVTEKTDGQNIQVTWKDGQIGFARNKGTVITPMSVQELQDKFGGRGPISDAFGGAAEDLAEAFKQINPEELNKIFKNGRVFANMEIIYPATKNVISYDVAVLQFHNLVEYDDKANVVETDMTGGATLQRIIQDANAHLQKTFSFIPPQRIKLGRVYDFEDQQAAFFNEIDQLRTRYNLKETDLVTEYHKAWWADVIRTKAQELGYEIPDNVLTALIYRWAFNDKSTNISLLKKDIDNPEFLAWVSEFDKKDFKKYQKQNMEPFETIFLRLGAVVLKNAENFLAANPTKSIQELKTELAQLIKELQNNPDPAIISKLEHELRRIQRLGGFDAIIPSEGIVFVYGGHTYKLTGAFAPVNQLLGVLKYTR
jgi:phosphopantetheine adenylyltransferase